MEDVFEGSQPGGRETTQGILAIIQARDESRQARMMAAVITGEGGRGTESKPFRSSNQEDLVTEVGMKDD